MQIIVPEGIDKQGDASTTTPGSASGFAATHAAEVERQSRNEARWKKQAQRRVRESVDAFSEIRASNRDLSQRLERLSRRANAPHLWEGDQA